MATTSKRATMLLLSVILLLAASVLSKHALPVAHGSKQIVLDVHRGTGFTSDARTNSDVLAKTRSQGTFRGNRLQHVDEYLAIPFAEPPTGERRFAKTVPAQPYRSTKRNGVRDATKPGSICIQPPSGDSTPDQVQSEDCLTLNIYKPKGLAPGRRVPVMFWLYGGSWTEGSISQPRINATNFVARSVALDEPVIFVAANYRVGAFGFLGGQAIVDAEKYNQAVRNAGLYDQLEALKWVHKHIEAFGGDPAKVTLFGESAGAVSVAQMTMADKGRAAQGLFRGAILESGSPSTGPRMPATHARMQSTYEFVIEGAGCTSPSMTAADEIHCLKHVDVSNLTAGNNAAIGNAYLPYLPMIDNYFVQSLPSEQLARGELAHIPFITGCNLDEGTEFPYPFDVTTDDAFKGALRLAMGEDIEPVLDDMLNVWTADPTVGSPYRPDFFGISTADTFYPPMGQNMYKRQAASAQDVFFETGRRLHIEAAAKANVPVWTYRFAQPSPVGVGRHATAARASMGVQHEAEIPFVFAQPPLQGSQAGEMNEALQHFASDDKLIDVSNIMSAAWIHFAHHLNPNGPDVPQWNRFDEKDASDKYGQTLWIQGHNTTMISDEAHYDETRFVAAHNKHFWI